MDPDITPTTNSEFNHSIRVLAGPSTSTPAKKQKPSDTLQVSPVITVKMPPHSPKAQVKIIYKMPPKAQVKDTASSPSPQEKKVRSERT